MSSSAYCYMCKRAIIAHSTQELRVCLHDVQITLRGKKNE